MLNAALFLSAVTNVVLAFKLWQARTAEDRARKARAWGRDWSSGWWQPDDNA